MIPHNRHLGGRGRSHLPAICAIGMLIALASACASHASAATITGTSIATPSLPANLTTLGTDGWAYWYLNTGTGAATRPPTNTKASPSVTISDITPVAGSTVRGSTSSLTTIKFSYTNGTSPTSAASQNIYGAFNAALGTLNTGVQLHINLPDTKTYNVLIWVSGYLASGKMTATLPGAATYQDTSFSYLAGKIAALYEFQVEADNPNDPLTLSYVMSASTGDSNSHVLIGGVAVSAIPEPASLILMLAGGPLLLHRRRTRAAA